MLRSPLGGTVVRDIVDGLWADVDGEATMTIGEDEWALPGLADAHAHLAGSSLPLMGGMRGDLDYATQEASKALAAGVLTIHDKGWSDETVLDLVESVSPELRPDIFAAGQMIAVEGGYYAGFAREIAPEEIGSIVESQVSGRADWIKLIGDWPRPGEGPRANFDLNQLRTAVSVADAAGLRVAIHTMARGVPSIAVEAGVHSVEHGLFLAEDDLGKLAERKGVWVPTVRRVEETAAGLRRGSSGQRLLHEGLDNVRRILPLALEEGVTVLTGTDLAGPSSDVAQEALKLAEYGASPTQVVRCIIGDDRGFDPGHPANAVLFAVDPTEELGVLAHPSAVIRLGHLL